MATPRTVPTTPFPGQKPGTSGLRKKTSVFQAPHYVENFVQSTFDALPAEGPDAVRGRALVVGGDGRFFNDCMAQTIVRMAHANGVREVLVGARGLLSTPAVSALVRAERAAGAFILTASHNPGGPSNDVGIKYNTSGGGPAPESLTEAIFKRTERIAEYRISDLPPVDLTREETETEPAPGFRVRVVSSTRGYVALMRELFDFPKLRALLARDDFVFVYDAMSGVAGPYAVAVFRDELGVPRERLANCEPSPDFAGGHPDPNLTYAHDLVRRMGLTREGTPLAGVDPATVPDLGAAADGDADRNMILGKQFFVTPSDSLAVLASKVAECVPFFQREGLKALARSMPTSAAVDLVAAKLKLPCFEVPVRWSLLRGRERVLRH